MRANIFRDAALLAEKSSLDSFTIRNLLYLGIAYRYQARYDSSFFYLRKALQIVDRNNYFSLRAAVNLELFVLYNILGTKDSATRKNPISGIDDTGS